jgi:predicted secreted protein
VLSLSKSAPAARTVLEAGLAGFVLLSVVACAPTARPPLKVVERDSGSMVELHVGDRVEIVLDSSPTAGYVWEVVSATTVVQQEGEPQFKADSEALGSGGTLTLVFRAVAPGEQVLNLIYHRVSEEGVPPLRTFSLDILVRDR